jgi:hypothetical protein
MITPTVFERVPGSKDANFRSMLSGPVGVTKIERLIQKLQLDREILADQEGGQDEAANCGGPLPYPVSAKGWPRKARPLAHH